ncbi:MAG: nitroreductase family protein [Elusimicrobia bacterium]|nr:nitroreductase family protein [Elusimicrobiota bacterium]
MDAFEAIQQRRSVRLFSGQPIAKEALERIADAGRLAPSARNLQPWEFVVVTDRRMLGELGAMAEAGRFLAQSAAAIAVFCRDTKRYLEDGSAATQNMLIAATALGIGSCWIAGDKKPWAGQVAERLGAPPDYRLVNLIALGYPKEKTASPSKRPLSEVVHWEKF